MDSKSSSVCVSTTFWNITRDLQTGMYRVSPLFFYNSYNSFQRNFLLNISKLQNAPENPVGLKTTFLSGDFFQKLFLVP